MADPNQRDAKLIQYLSEAYGKERELEMALQADIAMTTKAPYKKRLKEHLKETKAHAKALDKRIKKLGGGGQTVASLVGKATAMAKAPIHMVRGSGEQEKMLKNAKTQFTAEQEEISTYLAIEVFATKVGDSETAKLARDIRREEERMAKFLEGEIKELASRDRPGRGPREPAPLVVDEIEIDETQSRETEKSGEKSTRKNRPPKNRRPKKAAKKSTAKKAKAKS